MLKINLLTHACVRLQAVAVKFRSFASFIGPVSNFTHQTGYRQNNSGKVSQAMTICLCNFKVWTFILFRQKLLNVLVFVTNFT